MTTKFIDEKYNYKEHIKKPIDDLLQVGGDYPTAGIGNDMIAAIKGIHDIFKNEAGLLIQMEI